MEPSAAAAAANRHPSPGLYDLPTSDDDIEDESEPEAARAAANPPGQLQREPEQQRRKRGRSASLAAGGNDSSLAANSPATALGAAAPAQQHTAAPMAAAPSARATLQRQNTQVQHSMAAAHAAQRPLGVQQPRHAAISTTAERGAQQSSAAQSAAAQQQRQVGGWRQAVPMAPPRAALQTAQQPQPGGAEPAQRPRAASDARQQPAAATAPSSAAAQGWDPDFVGAGLGVTDLRRRYPNAVDPRSTSDAIKVLEQQQAPSCDAGDAGSSITMLLEKLSVYVHEKLLPGGVAIHSWAVFGLDVNGAQFHVSFQCQRGKTCMPPAFLRVRRVFGSTDRRPGSLALVFHGLGKWYGGRHTGVFAVFKGEGGAGAGRSMVQLFGEPHAITTAMRSASGWP